MREETFVTHEQEVRGVRAEWQKTIPDFEPPPAASFKAWLQSWGAEAVYVAIAATRRKASWAKMNSRPMDSVYGYFISALRRAAKEGGR
jgi:hypothetical protein